MQLQSVTRVSEAVASRASRREKIRLLANLLSRLDPSEVEIVVPWLSGELRQGALGVGPATVGEIRAPGAGEASLSVREVDQALGEIGRAAGPGSRRRVLRRLQRLFERATAPEQSFLRRLLVGELRQGAQEGIMLEAVAEASGVAAAKVRRAVMMTGDAGQVARRVLAGGPQALEEFSLRLFRPVKPMLARSAEDPEQALERLGRAGVEYKLDGARIQVHRRGEDVAVYTRRLNDETDALPEVVEAVRSLPARELVLDGEALALGADGRPRPFQTTMRRFGRVRDVADARRSVPLSCFFFDCLYLDGESLLDHAGDRRIRALEQAVPADRRVPRTVTEDPADVRDVLSAALEAGHEGAVAKALDAPYLAGRRGATWLKLKPIHTLDLVVLAAEWGHGRRRGWLSNLHLGARGEAEGFVMIGKTFKGMTDRMLTWQTTRLLELEVGRDGHVVRVRPELVVEVAFDGVQRSPRYPGGLALRFARVKGYREDKAPAEADTIRTLRAIHRGEIAPL